MAEPSQQGSVQSSKMLKLTCLPCAFQLKRPLSDSISVRGCMYINILYTYIYVLYMHYICMHRERERGIQTYYISISLHPQGQWARKVYLAPAYMKLVGMINRCLSRKVWMGNSQVRATEAWRELSVCQNLWSRKDGKLRGVRQNGLGGHRQSLVMGTSWGFRKDLMVLAIMRKDFRNQHTLCICICI